MKPENRKLLNTIPKYEPKPKDAGILFKNVSDLEEAIDIVNELCRKNGPDGITEADLILSGLRLMIEGRKAITAALQNLTGNYNHAITDKLVKDPKATHFEFDKLGFGHSEFHQ